jgi:AcrR family transcriptional regulator
MQQRKDKTEAGQSSPADHATRREILKAAEELFIAKGYKGVSMKDIAEEVRTSPDAHITPAALYYHFPGGKEELFVSMLRQSIEEETQRALGALASATDMRERLTLLTQTMLSFPIDRFSMLMRDAHEHLSHQLKEEALLRDAARELTRGVAAFLQEASDAGEITRQIPPLVLAIFHQGMCIALLNGLRFLPEGMKGLDTAQVTQMVVSALLDGIAITPQPSA